MAPGFAPGSGCWAGELDDRELVLRQPHEEGTMITPRFGAGKQALARGRGDVGVTWVGRGGTESLEPNPALPDRPSSVMSYLGDLGESLPL